MEIHIRSTCRENHNNFRVLLKKKLLKLNVIKIRKSEYRGNLNQLGDCWKRGEPD